MYIDALHLATPTVVAGYKEFHRCATYLDIADFAQYEGDTTRACTISPQVGRMEKSLQRLRPAALFQSPRDNESASTASMRSARVPGEAVDTVHTLQLTTAAPRYDHDPSTAPTTSEQADAALALGPSMIPALSFGIRTVRPHSLDLDGSVRKDRSEWRGSRRLLSRRDSV